MWPTLVLVLPLVATALLFFAGPARTWLFRRKPQVESLWQNENGDLEIVFIHGTFAYQTQWTNSDSVLATGLKDRFPNSNGHRLMWSGDNFQSARSSAADELLRWLSAASPQRPVLLIGHSHGGNIAAMAATHAESADIGVVTLSTPFITVTPRDPTFLRRRTGDLGIRDDARLVFAVFFMLPFILLTRSLPLFLFSSLMIVLFLLSAFGQSLPWDINAALARHVTKAVQAFHGLADHFVRRTQVRLSESSLLVVRTTGDEASGFLAIAHFVSFVFFAFLRALATVASAVRAVEDWLQAERGLPRFFYFSSIAAGFAGVGLLILHVTEEHWAWALLIYAGGYSFLYMQAASMVIAPLLALVGTCASLLLFWPYGTDLAWASAVTSLSVEATPVGCWKIITVQNQSRWLAHSQLYESVDLPRIIEQFVRDRRHSGSQ